MIIYNYKSITHLALLHYELLANSLETPKAVDYVMEQLKKSGLSPERCGHGVTAAIGLQL